MSQQPDQQQQQQQQNQAGQQQGQGGRISFQAIHEQARQLLRQYSIEKEAAQNAGLESPEGKAHMEKAEKIKAILVTYSKRQKLLQQQQQQKQAAAQAQSQLNGVPQPQQQQQLTQQQIPQQPVLKQAPIQVQAPQSSPIPIPDNGSMLSMSSSGPSQIATPQSQDGRSFSQQAALNGIATNTGNPANGGNGVTLTPGQQLQLKKQQLLNKYQQIVAMSEQFKKNMALIKSRLSEPNIDETTKADLLEKEREVQIRLENCRKCTQQIATQLKLAQQQAQQIQQQQQQHQNRNQANPPQLQQQLSQGSIPNPQLNRVPSAQTTTPGYMNTDITPGMSGDLSANSSNLNLNAATGTPTAAGAAAKGVKAPAVKKPAPKKQTKADPKKVEESPNKKQKTSATTSTAAGTPIAASGPTSTAAQVGNTIAPSTISAGTDAKERAKFQNLNIPEDLKIRGQDPVSVKFNNRPSMLGGNAIAASALSNPVMIKPEQFELEGERVLNKRKLKELVASVASEEGESEINIDGDVEELLLDLADEFVTSVTSFASRLARHRHSENLDVRDVQLHLERNWNIRIPGYAADEIRMIRKFAPNSVHTSKVNGVFINKSVDKAP